MSNHNTLMGQLSQEFQWLTAHPEFEERPATLSEFLGPDYLNIESKIRKRIREELVEIIGETVDGYKPTRYPYAMITGAIGIGKTTVASIVLPYLAHWVLCLKDPQDFFDLLAGSRIAFMQMSTSEKQVLDVVFGDIKARIRHSPWFKKYPMDPAFKNQIRFSKDVWIIPGDSRETSFEGYNILGGILDEADSHTVTQTRDYAEQGFSTIDSRIASRFEDRGFLLVIGQMKRNDGFAARKYREFVERKDAYAVRLAIWDSMGWDHYADAGGKVRSFYYDPTRRQIVPNRIVNLIGGADGRTLIKIPDVYRRNFTNNPEKALRDLAGMPMSSGDPFLSLTDKIYSARDRWVKRYGPEPPVAPDGRVAPWFVARESLKRVIHVDIAYSGNGDALGLAMGHVREVVQMDGEAKPVIIIDFLYREKALPGREIFLGKIRQIIYNLRNDRKFKIDMVTFDGFMSTDFRQQLAARRFSVDTVSVDKDMLPYSDLRDAIYEDRIEIPPYLVDVNNEGRIERVEIAMKELTDLKDTGKKVDHPEAGSKDVADSIAGVVFTLMGDRRYRRKVRSLDVARELHNERAVAAGGLTHPAYRGDSGFSAPVSPVFPRR